MRDVEKKNKNLERGGRRKKWLNSRHGPGHWFKVESGDEGLFSANTPSPICACVFCCGFGQNIIIYYNIWKMLFFFSFFLPFPVCLFIYFLCDLLDVNFPMAFEFYGRSDMKKEISIGIFKIQIRHNLKVNILMSEKY